jgi:N-methylhydantoinase A
VVSTVFRLGVDVGGTFTDVAVVSETGQLSVAKTPTMPHDHIEGVLRGIEKVGVDPGQITSLVHGTIVHGTTVVTNIVVQRQVPKVALITTKGFRDVLEIMRANRPVWGLYDIQWDKPQPLIPRFMRFEVPERIDYKGRVLTPLNEEEAADLVRRLKGLGVESIAVSFLFSHVNPNHEQRMKTIIEHEYPGCHISISSEVNPQVREYERTSTAVIDACVKPLADRYFKRLEAGLVRAGFKSGRANLMIMRSSGGVMSNRAAQETPIYTIESGPAGGTIGSVYMGELTGNNNLIAIDMGGTTFKVSIVDRGIPRYKTQGEIEWGIPFRIPMIDISEIGAGGGSIAWIDKSGLLRVGPQSAQAEPGPVCYGRGGSDATITDANLVLGRLDPSYLLGGEMKIDKAAAEHAISEKIAVPLGMDVIEAANGIIEIANANMLASMRVSSVERGYDPRDFATIAYGGAGPGVAASLARELGCKKVLIPPHPGIFSAIGMLACNIRLDYMHSFTGPLIGADLGKMNYIFAEMERTAEMNIRKDFAGEVSLARSADLRYIGQNYEVNTPVPTGMLTADAVMKISNDFNAEHRRLYGHSKPTEPLEIVTLRSTIVGFIERPKISALPSQTGAEPKARIERDVYFSKNGDFVKTPVYERVKLRTGQRILGPAIVEELDSTTVLNPSDAATVDEFGNIVVEL